MRIGLGQFNDLTDDKLAFIKQIGFDGFMIPDHVPKVDGDSAWNQQGRAHAVGYMKALLEIVDKLD